MLCHADSCEEALTCGWLHLQSQVTPILPTHKHQPPALYVAHTNYVCIWVISPLFSLWMKCVYFFVQCFFPLCPNLLVQVECKCQLKVTANVEGPLSRTVLNISWLIAITCQKNIIPLSSQYYCRIFSANVCVILPTNLTLENKERHNIRWNLCVTLNAVR